MRKIPFQVNEGGLVALLPNGHVEFLADSARTLILRHNAGRPVSAEELMEHALSDPLVTLDRFHLSAPAIAFVETTNLCNLRCKHCYADSALKRPDEMPTPRIKALLDEFAELGVLQVFLTGGEIFSHRDSVEIIRHARSKPFSTQIFTNGLLITEEKLAAIPPGQSFFISFDTADPERTVRGRMDFPKLQHAFEMMRKHGHVFRTAISVHRNNIQDAEEIFEWCAERGYPRPQWLETHPVGRALLHPDMLLRPEDVDEVFEVYRRCMERYSTSPEADSGTEPAGAPGSRPGRRAADEIRGVDTIQFCQRLERAVGQEKCGRSVVYVNSRGDVYPCSNCMSGQLHRAGNLAERSFADIWESGFDAFRDIRFSDHTVCGSCPVAAEDIWCQFRCPPLARNLTGDPKGCGATEYLQEFMLRAGRYWRERKQRDVRLTLTPRQARPESRTPGTPGPPTPLPTT
ncbi:radical SAM/SPASM domain-containing protein [Streptomyces sp. G1]|uniref:radical SAM/SPASM domain-containing protein n=1 Tax=Streptomyces sp. G1 TaxID=361572 RepID=UPI0020305680|nr:radical SAM protein [Streptomyces sp. G1]MCM1973886.1 radical SAM protein [Streptomyces sp. G1]